LVISFLVRKRKLIEREEISVWLGRCERGIREEFRRKSKFYRKQN